MVDPISDLLTRIRNAGLARHAVTRAPYSKVKENIVKLMCEEGYLDRYEVDEKDGIHKDIVVHLRYVDQFQIAIRTMRRVSKPGRRIYRNATQLPKVNQGLGTSIISTSKGVMTDREARKANIGGEILCEIW
ncbi:MAG: 30S ribosomal protein S8 [Myxococcota bacterium]|jgi:small subunit ribosomal protein S8|nr:30S ribosomal protein S8 [Myxococcota bacterium]